MLESINHLICVIFNCVCPFKIAYMCICYVVLLNRTFKQRVPIFLTLKIWSRFSKKTKHFIGIFRKLIHQFQRPQGLAVFCCWSILKIHFIWMEKKCPSIIERPAKNVRQKIWAFFIFRMICLFQTNKCYMLHCKIECKHKHCLTENLPIFYCFCHAPYFL